MQMPASEALLASPTHPQCLGSTQVLGAGPGHSFLFLFPVGERRLIWVDRQLSGHQDFLGPTVPELPGTWTKWKHLEQQFKQAAFGKVCSPK